MLVGLGQFFAVVQQPTEAISRAELKLRIHFYGFKRANFYANLAAHAYGDIDIEARRIKLLLAHIVRLLIRALDDVNALGRTLFLAYLASHATQACLPVRTVVDQERKVPRSLNWGDPLLRILDRSEPVGGHKTARKVPCSLRKTL